MNNDIRRNREFVEPQVKPVMPTSPGSHTMNILAESSLFASCTDLQESFIQPATARGLCPSKLAPPIDQKRSGPTENVPPLSSHWRLIPIAIGASLVAACSGAPSVDQANRALGQAPQVQSLMGLAGAKARGSESHLISDLSCRKSADRQYDCEALLRENPATGTQPTVSLRFAELSGEWRVVGGDSTALSAYIMGFVLPVMQHQEAQVEAAGARIARAKQDIQSLETALTEYRLDNSVYPSTGEGLEALVTRPQDAAVMHWHGPYLQGVPKDPWGRPYSYAYPGTHGQPYDLYTPKADGQTSGDPTAVIGNWNLTQ